MNQSSIAPLPRLVRAKSAAIAGGLLFVLLLAATVFWPATHGPFIFDDFPNLQNLAQLEGTLDRDHLGQYLTAFNGNPGRPLSALSFVIEDSAWPSAPLAFKRDNLLLHLLAGVLIFALSRRMGRLVPSTAASSDVIALAATAMWLLHPIQLSATMLVVQRMNILSTIFVLVGLIGYLKSLAVTSLPPLQRVALAGASLAISAVLAILCKENGILIFAYAVVLNLTVLRRDIAELAPPARRLLLAGTALPMLLVGAAAVSNFGDILASYRGRDFTMLERLMTQSRILVDYLRNIYLPRIGGQGLFHDGYPISHGLLSPPTTLLCTLLIVGLIIAAWRMRIRWPLFALAVFWFFAGHLIESTIVPLELYFEHRNYLPMFGPLFAIAAGVASIASRYRRVAWVLLGLWLTMITGLTAVNARTWGDRGVQATVWYRENPNSTRAVEMLASYQLDSGDFAGARRTLQEGLARIPAATELSMQTTLLDCFTVGITRPQWNDLLALSARVHYTAIVPDLVSRFGLEQRSGRCHGTMADGDFLRLSQVIIHNPDVAWRSDAMAFIYYEMFRQAAFERDLQKVMEYMDASYAYKANPLVPHNQALYLLTAGLPDDAMRYLRISEATPQPWIKRKLLDIKALNEPLWGSAREMKAYFDRRKALKRTNPAASQ